MTPLVYVLRTVFTFKGLQKQFTATLHMEDGRLIMTYEKNTVSRGAQLVESTTRGKAEGTSPLFFLVNNRDLHTVARRHAYYRHCKIHK